jgi:cell surface protein SprA
MFGKKKAAGGGAIGGPAPGPMGPKGVEATGKDGGGKPKSDFWANSPLNISNFNTSYAFTESEKRNMNIVRDHRMMHTASLNYSYQTRPKNIQPFKTIVKNKQLALIRDFNFYYLPSKVSMRTEVKRQVNTMQMRNTFDPSIKLPVTYNKALTTKRMYDIAYDLSRGLKLDYNAQAMSRVDELPGNPKTQANRDTIRAGLATLGRPTEFHQTLNVNWQMPLNKLPFMDFTSTSLRYSANYDWTTNSTSALNPQANPDIYFGSRAQNSNSIQFNGNANFVNFYNQVPFLTQGQPRSSTNATSPPSRTGTSKARCQRKRRGKGRKEKRPENSIGSSTRSHDGSQRFINVFTNQWYAFAWGNHKPGIFRDGSKQFDGAWPWILYLDHKSDITTKAGDLGWLTRNPKQPDQFQKTFTENLNFRAVVEPWKDIRIQINASKVAGLNSSSIFRFHDPLQDTTLDYPKDITTSTQWKWGTTASHSYPSAVHLNLWIPRRILRFMKPSSVIEM